LANMPVYQLLGGACRTGVLVYRHADGRDFKEVTDNVRKWLEQGYKVVRAQMGGYGVRANCVLSRPNGKDCRARLTLSRPAT